jgi:hypothetical protein
VITARRAQRFHELVEQPSTGGSPTSEYADLLEVVGALRTVPEPVPDPAFVAALRDRLVAEAESVLAAAAAERDDTDDRLRLRPAAPRARRHRRGLAAVVSGVALVSVSTTVAVASQSALPGDRLYSVKRGLESAHAELTFDRAARGRVVLDSAGTRLDEAEQLSHEHADPARVTDALDAFTQEATDGSDLLVEDYQSTGDRSSITTLRTFTATSMARLEVLQSQVPPSSYDALLRAAQTLDQVQQRALQVCPSCDGPVIGSIPGVLAGVGQTTTDSGRFSVPRSHHRSPASSTPRLPDVAGETMPPASVTEPEPSPSTAASEPPVTGDVQHTVKHLTRGLTHTHKTDLGSTVTDTTHRLLDTVDQVAGTLDDTVGGLHTVLPTVP